MLPARSFCFSARTCVNTPRPKLAETKKLWISEGDTVREPRLAVLLQLELTSFRDAKAALRNFEKYFKSGDCRS